MTKDQLKEIELAKRSLVISKKLQLINQLNKCIDFQLQDIEDINRGHAERTQNRSIGEIKLREDNAMNIVTLFNQRF